MVATRVAATFFVIAVHCVGQPASEKGRPLLARWVVQKAATILRQSTRYVLPCARFDGVQRPAIKRLPYLTCACAKCRATLPSWHALVRCDCATRRGYRKSGLIQYALSRARNALYLRTAGRRGIALPAPQHHQSGTLRDGRCALQCPGIACNAAAFARCAARRRAGHGVCHAHEACANGAVRSGHACAL